MYNVQSPFEVQEKMNRYTVYRVLLSISRFDKFEKQEITKCVFLCFFTDQRINPENVFLN